MAWSPASAIDWILAVMPSHVCLYGPPLVHVRVSCAGMTYWVALALPSERMKGLVEALALPVPPTSSATQVRCHPDSVPPIFGANRVRCQPGSVPPRFGTGIVSTHSAGQCAKQVHASASTRITTGEVAEGARLDYHKSLEELNFGGSRLFVCLFGSTSSTRPADRLPLARRSPRLTDA
jgi:hypothetical protein